METKKSEHANLEKRRSMFFQVGLLLALGFAFVAFEWQFESRISDVKWENIPVSVDVEDVVRTFTEPPQLPPQVPHPSFQLEIVETVDVSVPEININFEDGFNIINPVFFKETEVIEEPEVCIPCLEVAGTFGGKSVEEGFREYMGKNLKYPQLAIENNISGKVLVQFVIDQKGNAVDIQVIRSIDPVLDNEAIRLIKSSSGLWTPGLQHGKPVKVRYTFPILFQLQ